MSLDYPASGKSSPATANAHEFERVATVERESEGMPADAERQVIEWVNDAFAIVAHTSGAGAPAETNLRRGLGAIVRHLALSAPAIAEPTAQPDGMSVELSLAELRHVRCALDVCLTIFGRHGHQLNTAQRRIQILVRACRRNADQALQAGGVPSAFTVRPAER